MTTRLPARNPGLNAFDRRLESGAARPIAVALSGGADSILALRETTGWARRHGRAVIALCVDHRLQAAGAKWAAFAARAAEALGARARILTWDAPHPLTGVPAAARTARHRLLAAAARAAGAQVIVTGHTASDARENQALGQGPLSEWSPSPVWPEGRGLFFLRPLLDLSRAEVRTRLQAVGAAWIDDPANDDDRHARVRVRRILADLAPEPDPSGEPAAALARQAVFDHARILLPRGAFAAAGEAARRRVLGAAAVAAGGRASIPRAGAVARLSAALCAPGPVSATLAGARIEADGQVALWRNAGEMRRGGLTPFSLEPGEAGVWDGRYEVFASQGGEIRALAGLAAQLARADRRALTAWPAAVRPGLPVILSPNGALSCPILASQAGPEAQWLVPARFLAACGVLAREGQANF